ncbi:alginate O-acetyltransferase AlgX-related protein [Amycolatopsis antarctica]|uniref:alginate O-acetyltransferase AlgX-related protein n=1 Tax=Amycolatopsis antarctica TaxID=1854586 RepID=UPI00196B0693|nr:hypothetical protein [Amycolatopsis antarctica]
MAQESPKLPAVHEAWLPREHALHRPRHGGKQLTAIACALVFFVAPTLSWVFGARPSEIENHELAAFPSLADGWSFFTDLPAWATDQLVFRSGAIAAADAVSQGLFGEPAPLDQGTAPDAGPLPGLPLPPPDAGGVEDSGPSDGGAGYRRVVRGADGWLYYGYDADAKCSPVRPMDETVAKLGELREAVESSGRRFVFVVAPDKSTVVPEYLPGNYPGKDCATAASGEVWRKLTEEAGALDLRGPLRAAQQETGSPIYPPNDTHWTDEGSVVLTRELAEAVEPGTTLTWRSERTSQYTIDADLPPLLGKSGEKTNTAYDLRPDGRTDRTAAPIGSIDTPAYRVSVPVTGTVDEQVLIFGDSFTETSSRYLPGGFANLTMLAYPSVNSDPDTAAKAFADSQVVVVETVERAASSGNLPFLEDDFIASARKAMAARPIR